MHLQQRGKVGPDGLPGRPQEMRKQSVPTKTSALKWHFHGVWRKRYNLFLLNTLHAIVCSRLIILWPQDYRKLGVVDKESVSVIAPYRLLLFFFLASSR